MPRHSRYDWNGTDRWGFLLLIVAAGTAQGLDLSEFYRGAEITVQHPEMREWLAELLSRRTAGQQINPVTGPSTTSSD